MLSRSGGVAAFASSRGLLLKQQHLQQQHLQQQHLQHQHAASMARRTLATTHTGAVKFYLRNKGYGFVCADDHPDTDIFVHRSDIQCTVDNLPEHIAVPRYPYLKQRERVRFEIEKNVNGVHQAKNVTWVDGRKVTPERLTFLGGVHESAKYNLGVAVYGMLMDHLVHHKSNKTDDQLVAEIGDHFRMTHSRIANAEHVIKTLGMDLQDFPTEKSQKGRQGRYFFKDGRQGQQQQQRQQQPQGLGLDEKGGGMPLPSASQEEVASSGFPSSEEGMALPTGFPSTTPTESPLEKSTN